MKRTLLPLITLLVALTGTAQTIGEAFYVYRSDGMINAFFRSEVDSMAYSYYDVDSIYYDEVVTQVIYTPDSIYRIPLAMVDSVGFVTPPTVYKEDVTRMEYNLVDYVIGADGLTLKLKPNTPTMIIPVRGDKLVLLEGCDVLPYGFSGIVSRVETGSSSIDVVCEQAYLEDLFDSFCSVTTAFGCNPDSLNAYSPSSRRRVTYCPDDIVFSLGPYKISESKEVSLGLLFDNDLALKGGTDFTVEIQPTFRIHTFLMLSLVHGMNFSCSITGDLRIASQTSFYGGLKYNHDFDGLTIPFPIPMTAGLINFYINPGLFLRADATISSNINSTQVYTFGTSFNHSSNDQNTMRLDFRLAKSSIDAFGCMDGSVAGGAYVEYGFNLMSRKVARACIRGEFGGRFSGNFVLRNSDIVSAEKETKLYEKLKASSFEFGRFVNSSLQASVWKASYSKTRELYETIRTWDLVPTFSETMLIPTPGYSASLDAYTKLSGNCLFSVPYGFKLFDGNMNEVRDYDASSSYKDTECEMDHRFMGLEDSKPYNYKVYPTVNLFGIKEILAEPSAKLKAELKPVTLPVRNVTDISATARGRIDGHELLDETMKYGIAYIDVRTARNDTIWCEATTIGDDGVFSIEINSLKPQTTYRFFAYLIIDGETYSGTKRVFTTEEDTREAYYVWNGDYKTARYYYDHYCESRGGTRISSEHIVNKIDYAIQTVIFDSSFFEYHPKVFTFGNCSKLRVINNLIYLNTDNITDMCDMFSGCSSLKSLDLSNFNTSKVTRFGLSSYLQQCGMFSYCSSLTELNLKNFNISNANASDMRNMFRGCSSLTSVDLSSFYTSNVTCMENMFLGCSSLTSLDLSNFDTSNVKWMSSMFRGCSSLTSIDVSSFDTYNASVSDMFRECSSLTVLDLSSFRFPAKGSINMGGMFRDCRSLRTIYAGNWDTSDTYSYDDPPFYGCPNLRGGQGTKVGDNIYGYDDKGNPLTYYVRSDRWIYARIDGGKDWPGLFTEK